MPYRSFGNGRGLPAICQLGLIGSLMVGLAGSVAGGGARAEELASLFAIQSPESAATVDHSDWNKMLAAYVVASPDGINRVAYASLKAEAHDDLKRYIGSLEKVEVKRLGRSEQFAFWANLYNAKTLDIVLDRYPVQSIRDINLGGGLLTLVTGGPWNAKVVKVGGVELSLDDIEHGIMRPVFKDARVHYAVNCASIGCPNLLREAFSGVKLEMQLETAARDYINHPRGFSVEEGKVTASSIYRWYEADFGGGVPGVLAHARAYAGQPLKNKLEGLTTVSDYRYDWTLNDATR